MSVVVVGIVRPAVSGVEVETTRVLEAGGLLCLGLPISSASAILLLLAVTVICLGSGRVPHGISAVGRRCRRRSSRVHAVSLSDLRSLRIVSSIALRRIAVVVTLAASTIALRIAILVVAVAIVVVVILVRRSHPRGGSHGTSGVRIGTVRRGRLAITIVVVLALRLIRIANGLACVTARCDRRGLAVGASVTTRHARARLTCRRCDGRRRSGGGGGRGRDGLAGCSRV